MTEIEAEIARLNLKLGARTDATGKAIAGYKTNVKAINARLKVLRAQAEKVAGQEPETPIDTAAPVEP
jgi:hypothetical protein